MGNIIDANNKTSKKQIIKATKDSSITISKSNIIINDSDYQSFPNPAKNINNYPKINSKNNNLLKIKEKKDLLNNNKNKKLEKRNILNNSLPINNKIEKKINNLHQYLKKNSRLNENCNIYNEKNSNNFVNKRKRKNLMYINDISTLLISKNNKEKINLNNKFFERDSKFINFSIIDDKSELNEDSKLDNEINNNTILNEIKKKEESEYEYEFEDYINKLNTNNINIDQQLLERPLSSPFLFIEKSNTKFISNGKIIYKSDKKNINNECIQKKSNDINNLGTVSIYKTKIRKENNENYRNFKVIKKNKTKKLFETPNDNCIKIKNNNYIDFQKKNDKTFCFNSFKLCNKLQNKMIQIKDQINKQKNIINIKSNKIKAKNNFINSNNNSTNNSSHYNKTINHKNNNNTTTYINKNEEQNKLFKKINLTNNKNKITININDIKMGKINIIKNSIKKSTNILFTDDEKYIKNLKNAIIKNGNNNEKTKIEGKNCNTQIKRRKISKIFNERKISDLKDIIIKKNYSNVNCNINPKNTNLSTFSLKNCKNTGIKEEKNQIDILISKRFNLKQPKRDIDNIKYYSYRNSNKNKKFCYKKLDFKFSEDKIEKKINKFNINKSNTNIFSYYDANIPKINKKEIKAKLIEKNRRDNKSKNKIIRKNYSLNNINKISNISLIINSGNKKGIENNLIYSKSKIFKNIIKNKDKNLNSKNKQIIFNQTVNIDKNNINNSNIITPKKKILFDYNKNNQKILNNSILSKKINLINNNFMLKRNIYEIKDISNLLKENDLNEIIKEENILKTKNVVCFLNGQNLEIFNGDNKDNKDTLQKRIIQIKNIKELLLLSKNIIVITYLDKISKEIKKIGFFIDEEKIINEYINNFKKISNQINLNFFSKNINNSYI